MARLDQDMGILSKNLGSGGAGVYAPAKYEYSINGGKRRKTTRGQKVRRSKRRRTAKTGVLSALRKMFRL